MGPGSGVSLTKIEAPPMKLNELIAVDTLGTTVLRV